MPPPKKKKQSLPPREQLDHVIRRDADSSGIIKRQWCKRVIICAIAEVPPEGVLKDMSWNRKIITSRSGTTTGVTITEHESVSKAFLMH